MEKLIPKPNPPLEVWLDKMKSVVRRPKEQYYYVCDGNVYLSYIHPDSKTKRWHRLRAEEVLELFVNHPSRYIEDFLKEINGTPVQ